MLSKQITKVGRTSLHLSDKAWISGKTIEINPTKSPQLSAANARPGNKAQYGHPYSAPTLD
jgi:hypothetical protein